MKFRLEYRSAFFVALAALLISLCVLKFLSIDLKYERRAVARFEKWEQEDAEVIRKQKAQIERLCVQLAAEKRARADAERRLSQWDAKYLRQAEEFIKSDLERLGVRVVTFSDGTSHGSVAMVPAEKMDFVISYLHKNRIDAPSGPCGLGSCGLYVPVRDFYKAAELLRQIKPQLDKGWQPNQARLGIWEEKQS